MSALSVVVSGSCIGTLVSARTIELEDWVSHKEKNSRLDGSRQVGVVMAFCQRRVRSVILLLVLATANLHGQRAGAEEAKPVFGAKGSYIDYSVVGSNPIEERLTIKRKLLGIFSMGVTVTRQNAAGLNICATSDSNVGYAFFKDIAYRLDLDQSTITHVNPADIGAKLFYQERFEMSKPRTNEPLGDVVVFNAPDIGSGPKNPCSLQ